MGVRQSAQSGEYRPVPTRGLAASRHPEIVGAADVDDLLIVSSDFNDSDRPAHATRQASAQDVCARCLRNRGNRWKSASSGPLRRCASRPGAARGRDVLPTSDLAVTAVFDELVIGALMSGRAAR